MTESQDRDLDLRHAVLGLSAPVGAALLKQRYRELAKRWHPDRFASDPTGQAQASERKRQINDAFRMLAASAGHEAQAPEPRPASRETSSTLSRDDVERLIASINRSHEWTLWPRMSRSRWLSLAAAVAYFLSASVVLPSAWRGVPGVGRAVGQACGYFWLPLFLIWGADGAPPEGRAVFHIAGWGLMAAPAVVGLLLGIW